MHRRQALTQSIEPTADATRWEQAAATRWGSYITGIERATVLRAHGRAAPPRRALEVGCEGGRWSQLLTELGWTMTCTDVDATTLQACRARLPDATCVLVEPSAETLPCEDGSVNLLLCVEVRQLVQSDFFVPEAARVLAPGGVLVAVAWNLFSLRGLVGASVHRLRGMGPHPFYDRSYRSWERHLRSAGFDVLDRTGMCWFPFGRSSNSRLVPLATKLEGLLQLRRLASLSPWVIVTAQRPADAQPCDRGQTRMP